jgi:secretion/DNA translocation related CpaE-like protein
VPDPAHAARPLLVCGDETVVEDLLRLAAAAGAVLTVVAEAAVARPCWDDAPLVLVGDDQAGAVVRAGLPRRKRVVLVGRDVRDPGVWPRAVTVAAEHVVFLPEAESWLVGQLTDDASADCAALVVAVLGGRGGAGATTLATALSFAGVRAGVTTLLVDADVLGGGIDLVLGGQKATGLHWPGLGSSRRPLAAAVPTGSLPEAASLSVLSWDMTCWGSRSRRWSCCLVPGPVRSSWSSWTFRAISTELPRWCSPVRTERFSSCPPKSAPSPLPVEWRPLPVC